MILVMGAVGLAASLLLVGTYRLTAPRIAANRAAYLQASLSSVVDGADRFVALFPGEDGWVSGEDAPVGTRVFFGYAQDSLVGLAVEAAGQGYQDIIRILYGFDVACGCVVGMTVLESKETPGLGDKIEKDPVFLANFKRLVVRREGDPVSPVLVPRGQKTQDWEIDAISGATVSSQAITDILAASTPGLLDALERLGLPALPVDSPVEDTP